MNRCCVKWDNCKHIERNNQYLSIRYCPECGDFLSSVSNFGSLKHNLYKAIEKIGGKSDILSIIGGWRDTMNDIETEELLEDFIGEKMLQHKSDCARHSEPAYPAEKCNCIVVKKVLGLITNNDLAKGYENLMAQYSGDMHRLSKKIFEENKKKLADDIVEMIYVT